LNQTVDAAAAAGTITYLTRDGRRIAAIVPADLAESLLPEPSAEEDDLVLSVEESRRRFEQLAREQGVQPVADPAELRGPGMPEKEFRAFHEAVMSGRSGCGERCEPSGGLADH